MMKPFLLSLFLGFVLPLSAAIKKTSYSCRTVALQRYEVLDISLLMRERVAQPYDVQADAVFTSPSGQEQVVPLFYNGGKEYLLRFSASEAGAWTYRVKSELRSLEGKKGKIDVQDIAYLDRKGAVVIKPEQPQSFFWQNQDPYYLMGFECDFLFALDHHSPTLDKVNPFLDKVQENGFNHIVMNVYANDVVWKKDDKLKQYPQYEFGNDTTIYPFLGYNEKPDHSSLNPAFFQHLDRIMEAMNERDLIAHLMIYVWNKDVKWPKPLSEEDNRYFNHVVKRYQAFTNIVWDISKEALYYGVITDDYIVERMDRLRKLDSFKRLATVHDFGFCNRHKDLVDFVAHQDWTLRIYDSMLRNYNNFKNKPIYNIEHGGYEEGDFHIFTGNYVNAEYCLRRNYECAFAGAYSTYYWQSVSWNVLVHDVQDHPKMYQPRYDYFKHMTDFFQKHPFDQFVPHPQFNNSGYCLKSRDGQTYLFYIPKEALKVALNSLQKVAKHLSYQFFNTHTGEYSKLMDSKSMNIFSIPPSPYHMKADAIMIVKVVEK